MAAEQLFTAYSDATPTRQLFARNGDYQERPCLVDDAINATLERGCLVFGATPDAVFARVTNAAVPNLTTDVIGILHHQLVLVTAGGDKKAGMFTLGEFLEDTVRAASSSDINDANWLIIKEALLLRGINLVKEAYGDVTDEF